MKVTIHQPNYLPNAGFFHKILRCDCFVVYDTAQFVRSRFDNRNYIKSNGSKVLLTMPIARESHFKPIVQARVDNRGPWREKHWKTIRSSYQKAPYFSSLGPAFERIFSAAPTTLADMTVPIILEILAILGWKGQVAIASRLPLDTRLRSTDAIVDLLQAVKAKSYVAGASSKKYLEEEAFVRCGIALEYHQFTPPVYRQLGEPFLGNLSALDLVFNEGPAARMVLLGDVTGMLSSQVMGAKQDECTGSVGPSR